MMQKGSKDFSSCPFLLCTLQNPHELRDRILLYCFLTRDDGKQWNPVLKGVLFSFSKKTFHERIIILDSQLRQAAYTQHTQTQTSLSRTKHQEQMMKKQKKKGVLGMKNQHANASSNHQVLLRMKATHELIPPRSLETTLDGIQKTKFTKRRDVKIGKMGQNNHHRPQQQMIDGSFQHLTHAHLFSLLSHK